MKELLEELMDSAAGRADYADVRHVRSRAESIATRNGAVDELLAHDAEGVGVRVRVGGAWGFAATHELERPALEHALGQAIAIAEAQPQSPAQPLAQEPAARGRWDSPFDVDPFAVSREDKLELLIAADEAMRADGRVALTSAHFLAFSRDQIFASTEGALCEQRSVECGGGIAAIAIGRDEAQIRSYPASFRGDVAQAGWEHFSSLGLVEAAPRVAEEAGAPPTPPQGPAR